MTSTRDLPAEVTLDGDQALARGPGRPLSDESDDVMAMFQHVMQQFLDTQRSVMLAYLGHGPGPQRRSTPRPLATARPVAEPQITSNGHANGAGPTIAPVGTEPFHPTTPATNGNGFKQTTNGHEHHEISAVRTPEPQREVEQSRQIETVAPAETTVATTVAEVPTRDTLLEMLLKVVSDRTGYPTEMLGLDADLEADLGIDSIKRVEISGTIVQSLTLPPGVSPDLERLTSSRTLNQVVDTLVDMLSSAATMTSVEEGTRPFDSAPAGDRIGRFLLSTTAAPAINSSGTLARDGVVVIVDDERGVGARLASEIAGRGHRAVRITQETSPSGADNTLVADLQQPAELRRAVDDIRKRLGRVAALVHLPALAAINPPGDDDVEGWRAWRARTLHSLLTISQSLRQDLEESSEQGGSAVLVATSLGGAFGSTRPARPGRVPDGGLSGFAKTLAQEWPSVRVRAVDFDTDEQGTLVDTLLSELFSADNLAEVAYVEGQRVRVTLVPATTSESDVDPLTKDSVVVITGGARGITAEVAQTLAARYHSTFVLIGRTPAPSETEPDYAKGVVDRNELRKVVLAYLKSTGASPVVADVEREVNRIIGEREVRENLARIGVSAVRVAYRSCDVRNAAQFSALIDDIYDEFGRIDGVIHGAGIIEDKLVKDKQLDSFERVISTKVDSALTLARTLRPESLRFLVLFSSVSGRFGNRGQADYASANEVLNKLAVSLDASWPGRVVSVNWGPWLKAGMVSPEVQRQFAERQVTLISLPVGCQMLDNELRGGRKGEAEVVIGGTDNPEAMAAITRPEGRSTTVESNGGLALLAMNASIDSREKTGAVISRVFDVAVDRYLDDHRLDGRPVLPFAFASELMAEAAATAFPNLTVSEVRDIRLLNGLTFDQDVKSVLVTARVDEREASQSEAWSDVSVVITSPIKPARVHYRSTVRLSRGPAHLAFDAPLASLGKAAPFPMPVEDVYREWLFHGPVFQRIVSIDRIGPTGASAWLSPSRPSEGMSSDVDGISWLVDPILVDGAFQMQVIWARMHWDVTLLPAEVGSIHRFGPIDPREGPVRYELRIRKGSSAPLCHADHFFFDRRGTLVGRLQDVVGAGSRELNRLAGSAR